MRFDDRDPERWTTDWFATVASGEEPMSQRRREVVERRAGSLDRIIGIARRMGVHLTVFTDDDGSEIVAASRAPVRVLC
jgi:hypothetical protein